MALGRPVTASGALWPGLPASNLTDGNHLGTGTIAHPATGVATLGFYFQVDLAADLALNRIVLYNRSDCCPERLTNFSVSETLAALNIGNGAVVTLGPAAPSRCCLPARWECSDADAVDWENWGTGRMTGKVRPLRRTTTAAAAR